MTPPQPHVSSPPPSPTHTPTMSDKMFNILQWYRQWYRQEKDGTKHIPRGTQRKSGGHS